jgi:hypothetical protein
MNDLVKATRQPDVKKLAQLLHTVLNAKRFTSRADLTETLKVRAAKLKLPYDGASVGAAIDMVEGGGTRRDIPAGPGVPVATNARTGRDDQFILGRAEAADLLARLQRKTKTTGPRTMTAGDVKAAE